MIALALSSTVLAVALAVVVLCAVLRVLYVIGLREQARRLPAPEPTLQDRRKARRALRRHDPARALRLDAVDPL